MSAFDSGEGRQLNLNRRSGSCRRNDRFQGAAATLPVELIDKSSAEGLIGPVAPVCGLERLLLYGTGFRHRSWRRLSSKQRIQNIKRVVFGFQPL